MSARARETGSTGSTIGTFEAAFVQGTTHWLDGTSAAARTAAGVGTNTTLVRVVAVDGPCTIAFGASDVDATTGSVHVPADAPEYFAIKPGQYVSVLGGEACVTECSNG